MVEYIPFTRRVPVTQEFVPGDDEHILYERVSAYLQRETLIALPASQRQLITLVLRKLLASSTFAIASTLQGLIARVERIAQGEQINLLDEEDLEDLDELEEEWESEETATEVKIDPRLLREELALLRQFAALADGIKNNAKGNALLPALKVALGKAEALGGAPQSDRLHRVPAHTAISFRPTFRQRIRGPTGADERHQR